MNDKAAELHLMRVRDLDTNAPTPFKIVPTPGELNALRTELDLLDLRKLRFEGQIAPLGKQDWRLTGLLGATVTQPCVATLEPVQTRIDTPVERTYLAEFEMPDDPEAEMPEDDGTEALGSHINLTDVMAEALSLALPLYPRALGAEDVHLQVTEPGKKAMTDDEAKPFAALSALRDKLSGDGD